MTRVTSCLACVSTAVGSLRTSIHSLPSSWGWATLLSADWARRGRYTLSNICVRVSWEPCLYSTVAKRATFMSLGFCFSQKLPTKFKKFYAEFESMMVSCMTFHSPLLCRVGNRNLSSESFKTRAQLCHEGEHVFFVIWVIWVPNVFKNGHCLYDRTHRGTTAPTDSPSPNWKHQSSPSCPSFSKVRLRVEQPRGPATWLDKVKQTSYFLL